VQARRVNRDASIKLEGVQAEKRLDDLSTSRKAETPGRDSFNGTSAPARFNALALDFLARQGLTS
jgi:hypothetical protein